jgi:hypothetical protein
VSDSVLDERGEFGVFRPLFGPGLPFLDLLTMGPEAPETLRRLDRILGNTSSPHMHVRIMLREGRGWRTQLVAAVAAVLLPPDPLTVADLWTSFDEDSRVAPQIGGVLYFYDPGFLETAFDRLLCTTSVSNPRTASILRALLHRHPKRDRAMLERLDRLVLLELCAADTRNGGAQVNRWVDLVRPLLRARAT